MSNLFIIGNGFDLAHNLKTSYEDFHKYLIRKYSNSSDDDLILQDDIKYMCDENIRVSFLRNLLCQTVGYKWQDVENALSFLALYTYFDYFQEDFRFSYYKNGKENLTKSYIDNEEIARILRDGICSNVILEYFYEWINNVRNTRMTKKKLDFIKLLDYSDLFLVFNYTKTLEKVYKIKEKNICHIHGEIRKRNILFGHDKDCYDLYYKYKCKYKGAEGFILEIFQFLKKDTQKVLNNNINFFNRLSNNVDKIYSFGFSFSNTDAIYIKEICARCRNKDIVWYLLERDRGKNIEEKIKSYGFIGRFDYYNVSNRICADLSDQLQLFNASGHCPPFAHRL